MKDCFSSRAAELDDGISDAGTIGTVVASSCDAQVQVVAEKFSSGERRGVTDGLLQGIREKAVPWATGVVLQLRRAKAPR
jgi:hypothetical protein